MYCIYRLFEFPLDVIKGRVSSAFIIGLGLIILVFLIPFLYNRYKAKKGTESPL